MSHDCIFCQQPISPDDYHSVPAHVSCAVDPKTMPDRVKKQKDYPLREDSTTMAKILVHIPGTMLNQIDAFAKHKYKSRSELIRDALRRLMDQLGAHPVVEEGIISEEKS